MIKSHFYISHENILISSKNLYKKTLSGGNRYYPKKTL